MSCPHPRAGPTPEPAPQAPVVQVPVVQVAERIERFLDLLGDRGIADEDGPGRDDGRL